MVGKVLKEFQDWCDKQFEDNFDCCDGCKYYERIGDGTRFECFKEYLKDKCIE